jgi:uncharacterized Tic20 family protein
MTVTGEASQPRGWFQPRPTPPTAAEERLSALSYLGAIVLGPLVPLVVYLARRRRSPFVRRHAAQALNVALTGLLYALSGTIVGVLLAFDSGKAALAVMVPIAAIGWLIILAHLVRGAAAARRGDFRQIPAWICSPLVK